MEDGIGTRHTSNHEEYSIMPISRRRKVLARAVFTYYPETNEACFSPFSIVSDVPIGDSKWSESKGIIDGIKTARDDRFEPDPVCPSSLRKASR